MRKGSIFFCAVLLTLAGTAFAAEAPASPAGQTATPLPADSMLRFLADNPACREFTDGCSICAVAEGTPVCSTPAIACTVHAFRCTSNK